MPQLQELEGRSDGENHSRNDPGREARPQEKRKEAPEQDVEHATCTSLNPHLCRPRVVLGGDAERRYDRQDKKQAKSHVHSGWLLAAT